MELIPKKFYFNDIFDNFLASTDSNMKCDIYEKDNKYHIEMDIPGFDKKDIKVSCENNYLTIMAEKEIENDDNDKNYIRRERTYNKYQRSFYIGDIDNNNIDANFNNGILSIVIPKKQENSNQKYIDIK